MSNAHPRGVDRFGERGAALVQMTIAMLAITAFSTFVMDYGVFWVARRQAQNAADAGALAGAIAVAFGENPSPGGAAMLASQAAARANAVWGEPPSVLLGGLNGMSPDVRIGPCTATPTHQCVATDVFRAVQRGNPLPTYFGRLAEIDTQDVQATATAEVMSANESSCVQHWGIADRYQILIPAIPGKPVITCGTPRSTSTHARAKTVPTRPSRGRRVRTALCAAGM